MKASLGAALLLAFVAGCQSLQENYEDSCPYCGSSRTTYPALSGKAEATTAGVSISSTHLYKTCPNGCCGRAEVCRRGAVVPQNATVVAPAPTPVLVVPPPVVIRTAAKDVTSEGTVKTASLKTQVKVDPAEAATAEISTTAKTVKDKAVTKDNAAEAPASLPASVAETAVAHAVPANLRLFNTKRISINYEVHDVGPSGVSGVDLWFTKEGQTWQKVDLTTQKHSPYTVEVSDEGVYGFTLLARNGVGLGKQPPQPGEQPQMWAEVDTSKPAVHLLKIEGGSGANAQDMTILWKAADKNLGKRPITLSYSDKTFGPWTKIADKLPGTGKHVWHLPAKMPGKFFVRVEATDLAGNSAHDQTPKPLHIDTAVPTVSITSMEAGSKSEE